MTPPRPPPRPRPGNRPALDQEPEPAVRDARRFDEPKRTATAVGMPAPRLPGELAPTIPAARYNAPTIRVPTPQGVQVVTIRDADKTPPSATMPARSETPEQGSIRVLRERAEAGEERARRAEARARELEQRPAPVSLPAASAPLDDAAIGKFVRQVTNAVLRKVGIPAALLVCLGGGGALYKTATDKPTPPALTAAELDSRLSAFEGRIAKRLDKLTTNGNETIDLLRCQRKKVNQIGGSLLPAPDRMGSAYKPEPFEDDCPESPKRLPEPSL